MYVSLEGILATVQNTRADLVARHRNNDEQLALWLATEGQVEYPSIKAHRQRLLYPLMSKPYVDSGCSEMQPITQMMQKIWAMREDLQEAFAINSRAGRGAFADWYCFTGRHELGLLDLPEPYLSKHYSLPDSTVPGITKLMGRLRNISGEANRAFPHLSNGVDIANFRAWFYGVAIETYRLENLLSADEITALWTRGADSAAAYFVAKHAFGCNHTSESPLDLELSSLATLDETTCVPLLRRMHNVAVAQPGPSPSDASLIEPGTKPAGVNLVGYFNLHSGIGEDVRAAALALEYAGIPFERYALASSYDVAGDAACPNPNYRNCTEKPIYAVSLVFSTGMDTSVSVARGELDGFRSTYIIGAWPWELPAWPAEWRHSFEYVNEVWAPSSFVASAFREAAPNLEVKHVPMHVGIEASTQLTRAAFRLPESKFIFMCAFDGLSSIERKNPLAVIDAFQTAFPDDRSVSLVIKSLRAKQDSGKWKEIESRVRSDNRVVWIDADYDRTTFLGLLECCDCFVSLHRSEGFGRIIAEAMALEKPVIATNFSGNCDFTTSANSMLVPCVQVPVTLDGYRYGDYQNWAAPNISVAADMMMHVRHSRDKGCALAKEASKTISRFYGLSNVARAYIEELGAILSKRA